MVEFTKQSQVDKVISKINKKKKKAELILLKAKNNLATLKSVKRDLKTVSSVVIHFKL